MSPEPKLTGSNNSTRTIWVVASGVCLLFIANNAALGPLMAVRFHPGFPQATLLHCLAGVIGAQAGLHAIWCVLSPVRFSKRLSVAIGAGIILFAAWAWGYRIGVSRSDYPRLDYWGAVAPAALCLPLLALAIQFPLWIMRGWLGWQIAYRIDTSARLNVEGIRISDLLIATTAVAMALAVARVWPWDDVSHFSFDFVLLLVIVAAIISLFTTLPMVLATLRAKRLWLALTAALLPYLVLSFASLAEDLLRSKPVFWQPWANFTAMLGAFFVCLSGAMLLVRHLGFRLYWGGR